MASIKTRLARNMAWAMVTMCAVYATPARAAAGSGDGTMIVSPATNNAPGTSTNVFKFSFRADSVGSWSAGAQVRLTVPAGWSQPQTNAAANPGYVKSTLAGGTAVSIESITGTGPWDVTLNYQGANGTSKGFDLAYTNVAVPAVDGDYPFIAASKQAGSTFTNLAASPVITVVTRQSQTISFPAIDYAVTPNGLTLAATSASGLPITFSVASGPAALAGGSNLTFSATGTVKVAAAQAGNVAWYPAIPVTNTFPVFAGGSMTANPALAMAGNPTNVFRFKFRGDDVGAWQAGSQVRITIPETWPQPQTNSAANPGYVKPLLVSGTAVSIQSITGTGPWDITVNYQGAKDNNRGFDLTYTNLTTPSATGVYVFPTVCQQRGIVFTNSALDTTIELVEGSDQTISFPQIPNQLTSNDVVLAAAASSGLPVGFSVASGPATIANNILSFSNTGLVSVVAYQGGNAYWRTAPTITNTFMAFAGGTLTVAPTNVTATTTDTLKFSLRADGVGAWGAGSQVRLTIPAEWPQPQTNSAAGTGYVSAVTVGTGGTLSFAAIEGTGPWDVVVNYAGGYTVAKGFDLTYTNVVIPSLEAVYPFPVVCKQFGMTFTNAAMAPIVTVLVKTNQTLEFPPIPNQLTTNKVVLSATASSGLPASFTVVSGPATIASGSNMTFTSTGVVRVAASQAGNGDWLAAPPVTNSFMAFAGGTLAVSPIMVTAGSTTNTLKFSFRADGIGAWGPDFQMRLTIPAEWPEPRTNSAANAGYVKAALASGGGTAVSIDSISGAGPWDVVVNYAGGYSTAKGFDLTYTNITIPFPETVYTFSTVCRQFGMTFTNASMVPSVSVIVKTNQTIAFPPIDNQYTTNKVILAATASSGLPVSYTLSGPASLSGGSNLTFTSTGMVRIVASQYGNLDWHPAPSITNSFTVFAGGTLALSPAMATAGSTTNTLKFSFRTDGDGTWGPDCQMLLRIPAEWPQPQTNSASGAGYVSATAVGSYSTVSLEGINGSGPWDVVVNYAGGPATTKGFDLTYTNLVIPGPETIYTFPTVCRQFGMIFTNETLAPSIPIVSKTNQTIDFPSINNQLATNRVVLGATASSGLPVTYVVSGPYTVTGVTNLAFTGTGVVSVVASQAGNMDWHPAVSITNTFRVFAGGTMALTPDFATTESATNVLKFSFRGDGIGPWQAGSQIQITIPEGWAPPQTNLPTDAGYVKVTPVNSTVSLEPVAGTGPWTVTVNYQGTKEITRGFDLVYTNAASPVAAGAVAFDVLCRQAGFDFVNPSLNQGLVLVEGHYQTLAFPAIGYQISTNKVALNATCTSGLPITYTLTGPCALAGGTNLTFSNTGLVSVIASQRGNLDWHPAPSVTNDFLVFAGGTLALTPATARSGSTTNGFKFAFRGDDVAIWQAGSQVRITVPGGWPMPQTNSPATPGYVKVAAVSAIAVSIASITGEGPWDVTVNYQALKDDTRGFDLTYTNIVIPAAGVYSFGTACQQAGVVFTNPALTRSLTVVEGANQTIEIQDFADPIATNKIGLKATATSGMPVLFAVQSGPATLASATNLSFTGTGVVVVTASQAGSLTWNPASTSRLFTVSPAMLVPVAAIKNKTYNGNTTATLNSLTMTGKAAGDTVSLNHTTILFENRNVGTDKQVVVSGLTLSGGDAPLYQLTLTAVTSTASILPRTVMVQSVADSKVYDGTTGSAGIPVITNGSVMAVDTGVWTQVFETKTAGDGKTLIPAGSVSDGNGGTNYTVLFSTVTNGAITPRELGVSGARALDKVYDGTVAAVIADGLLEGAVPGDDVDLDALAGEFAQADVGADIPVTGLLTLKGADAANYSLVQPAGLSAAILDSLTPEQPVISGSGMEAGPGGTAFRLNWQGQSACSYHVEYTDSLNGPWLPLPGCGSISGSNGVMRTTDTNGLPACRFYRIIMQVP